MPRPLSSLPTPSRQAHRRAGSSSLRRAVAAGLAAAAALVTVAAGPGVTPAVAVANPTITVTCTSAGLRQLGVPAVRTWVYDVTFVNCAAVQGGAQWPGEDPEPKGWKLVNPTTPITGGTLDPAHNTATNWQVNATGASFTLTLETTVGNAGDLLAVAWFTGWAANPMALKLARPTGPSFSDEELKDGTLGAAYSDAVAASATRLSTGPGDPVGPITYAVSSGALPPGLTLNPATGAITGTPTSPGRYRFDVTATDEGNGGTTEAETDITIPLALSGTEQTPFVGSAAVEGATGYALNLGTLPAGLTLNTTTGAIEGTPTETGTFTVTVRATVGSSTIDVPVTIVIDAITPPDSPASASDTGTVGTAYVGDFAATGASSYSVEGDLPPGLFLNTATGEITGTPTRTGEFTFTIIATNAGGQDSQEVTITIGAVAQTPATPSAGATAAATTAAPTTSSLATTGADGVAPTVALGLGGVLIGAGLLLARRRAV